MNNDIFSTTRFVNYAKQYACENKKKLIQFALTIIGGLIFASAITPVLNGTYRDPYNYDPMWAKESIVFWAFLFMGVAIGGAFAFSTYDTKGKRINLLTLPVSNLEKYLTCVLFYGLGVYLCFFFGFFIADYIRVLTAPIYAAPGSVIEPMPINYLLTQDSTDPQGFNLIKMLIFITLICTQAYFVLAGTIWPKYGMMRGFLSLIGLYMLSGFMVYLSFETIFAIHGHLIVFRFESMLRNWNPTNVYNTVIASGYTVGILTTIGLYLLSYLRFKEMESIERW